MSSVGSGIYIRPLITLTQAGALFFYYFIIIIFIFFSHRKKDLASSLQHWEQLPGSWLSSTGFSLSYEPQSNLPGVLLLHSCPRGRISGSTGWCWPGAGGLPKSAAPAGRPPALGLPRPSSGLPTQGEAARYLAGLSLFTGLPN